MEKRYSSYLQILKSFVGLGRQEEYDTLRGQSTGSKFLCALIVAFLTSFITLGLGGVRISADKDLEALLRQIPEFSYEDGNFHVDGLYEDCVDGRYILIATDIEYFNYGSDRGNYPTALDAEEIVKWASEEYHFSDAILISQKNLVRISSIPSESGSVKWSNVAGMVNLSTFSNDTIMDNYKGFIVRWAMILAMLYTPVKLALLFFVPLLYTLIGLIVHAVVKNHRDFTDIYWISFYINIAFVIMKSILGIALMGVAFSVPAWVWLVAYVVLIYFTFKKTTGQIQTAVRDNPYYRSTEYGDGSYGGAGSYGNTVQGFDSDYGQSTQSASGQNTTMSMQADDDEFNAFMAQRDAEERQRKAQDTDGFDQN